MCNWFKFNWQVLGRVSYFLVSFSIYDNISIKLSFVILKNLLHSLLSYIRSSSSSQPLPIQISFSDIFFNTVIFFFFYIAATIKSRCRSSDPILKRYFLSGLSDSVIAWVASEKSDSENESDNKLNSIYLMVNCRLK